LSEYSVENHGQFNAAILYDPQSDYGNYQRLSEPNQTVIIADHPLRFLPLRSFAPIPTGGVANDEMKPFAVIIGKELSENFVASHSQR
jgi:hypothetical protein